MNTNKAEAPRAIIVMGVSGCGKSSIARLVAERLGYDQVEGDDLHPAANVEKMSAGIPLDDADRWPWLDLVGAELAKAGDKGIVVTCSALKKVYRERLRAAAGQPLAFVFLNGSEALLTERIGARAGHFMPTTLLRSQLDTLEDPTGEPGVVTVDIDNPLQVIADNAVAGLKTAFG